VVNFLTSDCYSDCLSALEHYILDLSFGLFFDCFGLCFAARMRKKDASTSSLAISGELCVNFCRIRLEFYVRLNRACRKGFYFIFYTYYVCLVVEKTMQEERK
jgi:hypothetical protein